MALTLLLLSLYQITALYASANCDYKFKSNVNYDVYAERVYYVACVEVQWNYAPYAKNVYSGKNVTNTSHEATWLWGNGVDRIGATYWKAVYREYTNACFKTQKRSEADEHLGSLGPNFRALTGEKIKIYYKNMCSFPTSLHGHGVAYDKLSEGAPYLDDDGVTGGDVVAEDGGKWIYIWYARNNMVDENLSSKMWLYHSHVNAIKDIYTGLFGAIIVTKKGMETSKTNLMPKDVDREFTTFMVLYEESRSMLFEDNLAMISDGDDADLLEDEGFIESNKMHAINGYLFGNLDTLSMEKCESVRWYTCSLGNEVDGPHSPHWHGSIAVDSLGDNTDTLVLIAGTTYTVTMTVDMPGVWLYHCHVFDHIAAGMVTLYTVEDNDKSCNGVDTGGNAMGEYPAGKQIKHRKYSDDGDSDDSDDGKCFIGEECDDTEDCCVGGVNPAHFGVACSSKYKGSTGDGDMGCCIKPGFRCSNDEECCKKSCFCHKGSCTKLHNLPGNRRLLTVEGIRETFKFEANGSMVHVLNAIFAVMVVVAIACFVCCMYCGGKKNKKNVYSSTSGESDEELIEFA